MARVDVRIESWACPVEEHGVPWRWSECFARGGVTVEWADGVAYCTFRGCDRSSQHDDGSCGCDGDDYDGNACAGQCCGAGQCSCSWPKTSEGGPSGDN